MGRLAVADVGRLPCIDLGGPYGTETVTRGLYGTNHWVNSRQRLARRRRGPALGLGLRPPQPSPACEPRLKRSSSSWIWRTGGSPRAASSACWNERCPSRAPARRRLIAEGLARPPSPTEEVIDSQSTRTRLAPASAGKPAHRFRRDVFRFPTTRCVTTCSLQSTDPGCAVAGAGPGIGPRRSTFVSIGALALWVLLGCCSMPVASTFAPRRRPRSAPRPAATASAPSGSGGTGSTGAT